MVFSILYGTLFIPLRKVEAGFFSSLLGTENQAFAETDTNIIQPPRPGNDLPNLQDASLALQAGSFQVQDEKNNESTSLDITDDTGTALVPLTGPLGVSDGSEVIDSSSQNMSVYVVRKGDSTSQVADMFGVSVNTILWANDMKKGDKLVQGDVLLILPVSGLEHTVTKGQTLQSIAKLYKADENDIVDYNNIAPDAELAVGDKLIIPDAQKSEENDKPIKNLGASIAKDKKYYENHPIKNLSGYYVNPAPGYRKSQGIHDNNGVDLAISTGTPIHAAAAGVVLITKTGCPLGSLRSKCGGGWGNMVLIQHPNGTQTLYAHQSSVVTRIGATVAQGETIGYVGSTGRSSGPHLHFEVHGARNPGADGSWAN